MTNFLSGSQIINLISHWCIGRQSQQFLLTVLNFNQEIVQTFQLEQCQFEISEIYRKNDRWQRQDYGQLRTDYVLVLVILGSTTDRQSSWLLKKIGTFLFASCNPRWPKQVQVAYRCRQHYDANLHQWKYEELEKTKRQTNLPTHPQRGYRIALLPNPTKLVFSIISYNLARAENIACNVP
jgi:hypothetical protein